MESLVRSQEMFSVIAEKSISFL